jgi:hypothetical protein
VFGIKKNNNNGKFSVLKGYLLGTLMGVGCLAALTSTANASIILDISDGNGSGPFGTITLTQLTSSSVSVDVSLGTNYSFVDTGSHQSFGFNLTSGLPTATINVTTTGFAAAGAFSNGFAGSFAYAIACTGCGSGGSSPLHGPLDFTVSVASGSLSVSDFIANSAGHTFAADVIGPTATGATFTGLVESSGGTAPAPTIPEPLSLSLVGGGLLALGLLRKRLPRP